MWLFIDRSSIEINTRSWENLFGPTQNETMVVDRKKQKALALLYLAYVARRSSELSWASEIGRGSVH